MRDDAYIGILFLVLVVMLTGWCVGSCIERGVEHEALGGLRHYLYERRDDCWGFQIEQDVYHYSAVCIAKGTQ